MDMVYGTCLRILGDAHAAEDAAQATFLLLSQKAKKLSPRINIAGWLFRAAKYTAMHMKRQRARQAKREREAAMKTMQERNDKESLWEAIKPRLDEAIAALPRVQRDVVVMRYLQGLPEAEIAREQACPVSTVATRLSRALTKLRARMMHGGIAVPAGVLPSLFAQQAITPAPAGLAASAQAICLGKTSASAAVMNATQGAAKTMLWIKAKIIAATVTITISVTAGGIIASKALAHKDELDSTPETTAASAQTPTQVVQMRPIAAGDLKTAVLADAASAFARQNLKILNNGLDKLYGITVKQSPAPVQAGANIILGAKASLATGTITQAELDQLGLDGYLIKCGDQKITITGQNAWSTRYGIYAFFEKLGVRYYNPWPYQPDITMRQNKQIPAFTLTSRPVFGFRNGLTPWWKQSSPQVANPKTGLNPELFDQKKTGSDLWIDHTAGYLVPKLLYLKEHPEYYAMGKDGKRVDRFSDHRTPLCLSNPEVTRISIQRALGWVANNPEKTFFFITYGDTGLWCQCQACLKLDPKPGQYATRLLRWVNPIARAIGKKYPKKIILTFAYGGTDEAPPVIRPEKNIWIIGSTGLGNVKFWDHVFADKKTMAKHAAMQKMEKWLKIVPKRYLVCEYQAGVYKPAMVDTMAARLRYYQKKGLRGIAFSYGRPINFTKLWCFLYAKMMWDPTQDIHSLTREFIGHHYGVAAKSIQRFFDCTHEQYRATLKHATAMNNIMAYPKQFYERQYVEKALAFFAAAEKQAKEACPPVEKHKPYCTCDACKAHRLHKEITNEISRFLEDAINHQPAYDFSDENNRTLLFLLNLRHQLAQAVGNRGAFVRYVIKLTKDLEKKDKRYGHMLTKWMGGLPELQPIRIKNGLHFTPEMFTWADFGPEVFPGRVKSHAAFPSPPKFCVGVYMKVRGGHGQVTSSRMAVDFTLAAIPEGRQAILDIEAQDAISKWLGDRGKGWKTSIKIFINKKEIFTGECGFVRGNWSRRRFPVPAGVLQVGSNRLIIENISRRGWFAGCWLLLSDAKLTFEEPQ